MFLQQKQNTNEFTVDELYVSIHVQEDLVSTFFMSVFCFNSRRWGRKQEQKEQCSSEVASMRTV